MSLLHLQLRFLYVHVGWEFLLYIYHLIKIFFQFKKTVKDKNIFIKDYFICYFRS